MSDMSDSPPLALATAGQLRRAGFAVDPADTDDSATTGFEVLSSHTDEYSRPEHERAVTRGDAFGQRGPRP